MGIPSGYGYGGLNYYSEVGMIIWIILSIIFAIAGGILVYILFLNPKKPLKLQKFGLWLQDFLGFKVMILETILKVCYLISTIFVVLFSFALIGYNFLAFLLCLVLGPIIIRILYESTIMFIMLWKNTNDINKKLK